MTNLSVIKAFVNGGNKNVHSANLYTDGKRLVSYSTIIAERVNGMVVVNSTKYSVTTSKAQGYLRCELSKSGCAYVEVDNVPMNESSLMRHYAKKHKAA